MSYHADEKQMMNTKNQQTRWIPVLIVMVMAMGTAIAIGVVAATNGGEGRPVIGGATGGVGGAIVCAIAAVVARRRRSGQKP